MQRANRLENPGTGKGSSGEIEIGMSVVTIAELAHGAYCTRVRR
jgi:hypothetical protein